MQHQISVITLGVSDLDSSRRFYTEGFGWTPVFDDHGILFFQMNGLVLAVWSKEALAADMNRPAAAPGSIARAHNVGSAAEVDQVIASLAQAGATVLRPAPWRLPGYVADPDGHAWEIAWNPAWPIDSQGHVRFGL
jgi:catechol 2,3-dioxygenase-like lactoylglutathione lyase family enzyme